MLYICSTLQKYNLSETTSLNWNLKTFLKLKQKSEIVQREIRKTNVDIPVNGQIKSDILTYHSLAAQTPPPPPPHRSPQK